jgi:hypothetical protein
MRCYYEGEAFDDAFFSRSMVWSWEIVTFSHKIRARNWKSCVKRARESEYR